MRKYLSVVLSFVMTFGVLFSNNVVFAVSSSTFSSMSASTQSGVLTAGTTGSTTYTVTVNRSGNGNLDVALSLTTSLPSGVTASFVPSIVSFTGNNPTSKTSILTLSTTNTSPAGVTNFTIQGVDTGSGGLTKTTIKTLTINTNPDNIAPVIASHSDVGPIEATSPSGATVTYTAPNATDNIDATAPAVCSPVSGTVFTLGSTVITCNKTDTAGNFAIATNFNVIVSDTTAPVIAIDGSNPQTILVGASYSELGATVSDNHDIGLTATIDHSAVDINTIGDYSVTYNVTDSHSNVAITKTRTVKVRDQEAPVITLEGSNPQIIEVHNTYTELGATVADNHDSGLTAVIDSSLVDMHKLGSYSVTYNSTDTSENVAIEATRTVNVIDSTAPVIVLNGSNPMNLKKGEAYVEPGATATDNYDIGPITVVITGTVNTAVPATYTKTYSATDSTGNPSSTTRTVVVRNLGTNANLSALVPSAGTLNPEFNSATTSYTVVLPFGTTTIPTVSATTSDEFATKVITQPSSVTGTATVVVTSEDTDEERVVRKTYTVVFSVAENPDHTAPVINLIGSSPVNVTVGDTYSDEGATAQDDIDGNITKSIVTVNNVNTTVSGTYTVTYNVNDAAGNKATEVTRIVNVNNQRRSGGYRIILPNQGTGGQVLGAVKFIFTKNLKFGSKGNEVTELQKFLNAAGYDCGAVDGKFKAKTQSCVKAFQKANPPLKVDGVIGAKARAVLNK